MTSPTPEPLQRECEKPNMNGDAMKLKVDDKRAGKIAMLLSTLSDTRWEVEKSAYPNDFPPNEHFFVAASPIRVGVWNHQGTCSKERATLIAALRNETPDLLSDRATMLKRIAELESQNETMRNIPFHVGPEGQPDAPDLSAYLAVKSERDEAWRDENEMCEQLNAVIDKYGGWQDGETDTYAENFQRIISAAALAAPSAPPSDEAVSLPEIPTTKQEK
jgi:hypothetical protein